MRALFFLLFTTSIFYAHAGLHHSIIVYNDSLKWTIVKKDTYQISYPDSMILEEEPSGVDLMISTKISSESDSFQENISVTFQDLGAEITLSVIMGMIEGEIRKEIQQGEIIENYDVILGERTARRIRFTNVVNGMTLTWVQHYLVVGNFFYVITYTGEEEVYLQSLNNVQAIISTFDVH